jgi:hypothetical protein
MKKVLQRLDSVHKKLLDEVSPLDPQVYSKRPAENEWSVGEIVHHLCLVEARVIKELEGAISRAPQRVSFFRRFIPTSVVSVRLLRVKAPEAMKPLDAPVKEAAVANFERARASLKTLCVTHGNDRFRNLIFKHPVFGEIDGVATVSFISYHEQRHYKQIREVLKKLAKTN